MKLRSTTTSMRKIVLGLGVSLDGYIARPDGAVDFLFMPKDYSMAPFFATVDTAIMGRKTLDAGLNWAEDERRCHIRTCRCMYSPRRNHLVNEYGVIFVNETPASFIRKLRRRPGKD